MRLNTRLSLKTLLCSCLLVMGLGAVNAQAPATAAPEAGASNAPVPLLWRVGTDTRSVYLLGSFHLLKPDDYPLHADVDAAFADSTRLVFEIPPEELSSPALGMKMGQAAMRTDGTTLDSALPPETAAALAAWTQANAAGLAQMQLPPQVLQMFQPWFVGLMVSIVEMTKFGLQPELGMDMHLAARATEAGKPTSGLETGDTQIAFFSGMTAEQQLQFLQSSLETTGERGQQEIERLHAAWRAGDAQHLWNEMAVQMRDEYPEIYARINVERNDAWVPQIEALLADEAGGNALVVVGALHLLGEDGVVEKLAARGHAVERIGGPAR